MSGEHENEIKGGRNHPPEKPTHGVIAGDQMGQDEQAEHDHQQAIGFDPRECQGGGAGQKPDSNPPAIKRRHGKQVEQAKHQIGQNEQAKGAIGKGDPFRPQAGLPGLHQMRGEPRQQGQGEIRGRASRRHRHHAIARVAELPDIDRHGLGPAEHGLYPA